MRVKQFLRKFNAGRSTIVQAELENVRTGEKAYFRSELLSEDFGDQGDLKVNSFTILGDKLVIYVEE